ncbi:hypothetical protein PCANC_05717 [Puccinia coronata f. sp. avenae]|uniref:Uncharacterized protein n=1 Tax=Puccinia coronata f. sp. avenae TaxID=200324 RepID=A0A2N5VSG5_9BASI|nr:hypothetical protein PCANC_05717 [Puccinia coronata f. sp. avenae]
MSSEPIRYWENDKSKLSGVIPSICDSSRRKFGKNNSSTTGPPASEDIWVIASPIKSIHFISSLSLLDSWGSSKRFNLNSILIN